MNTPETDKFWKQLGEQYHMSPYQFAAMLETERNEARKQRDELMAAFNDWAELREWLEMDKYIKGYMTNESIKFDAMNQAIANVKGETV